jgi:hypothetical protein
MHNYDGRNIYEFMKEVRDAEMLTPARQRSPQHSEFVLQVWSRGLHAGLGLRPSRILAPGAAAAKATKAKAKTMVDLKNCITSILGVMWERSRGDWGNVYKAHVFYTQTP